MFIANRPIETRGRRSYRNEGIEAKRGTKEDTALRSHNGGERVGKAME